MPVDDIWFKRGPDGKRVKSGQHGKGKRYRVRYTDASGAGKTRYFKLERDAKDFDALARTGQAEEVKAVSDGRLTFQEYGERWRLSRRIAQSLDYQRHTDSRLRNQLYPVLGDRPIRGITVTDVLEWIAERLDSEVAGTSLRTYYDLLNQVMGAAVVDKVISDNPCKGVRLSMVLRGLSRAPKWVPNDEQVLALLDVVSPEYRAAVWLGAGQGLRVGEVLGIEEGNRCVDYLRREVHVVQQLRFHQEYGGYFLAVPKANSVGDVDLDDEVALALGQHLRQHGSVSVTLPDITRGIPDRGKEPPRRKVALLFPDDQGRPMRDQRWSDLWKTWRAAAGWPVEGTFHSLRHYFATTLITHGADPTDVQKALRHSNLKITLETYVHWWPKSDRKRSIIGSVLAETDRKRALPKAQDRR